MRIAVSVDNKNGLDSIVHPHFGRCPYFVLVDMDGREIKAVSAVDNPFYGNHRPGQVPAFINSHGVNVMLTGGMGQRAIMSFGQFGIQPVTGAAGTVRQSLERYLGGVLDGAAPCRESVMHAHQHDDGAYEEDEIGRLREEAEMLRQQLDEVSARLKKMDESD
jgi:predicted Fe-Mo cluster-binding NifX family protein